MGGGGIEEEGVWGESRRKIGGEGDRIRDKGREWEQERELGRGKDKMDKKEGTERRRVFPPFLSVLHFSFSFRGRIKRRIIHFFRFCFILRGFFRFFFDFWFLYIFFFLLFCFGGWCCVSRRGRRGRGGREGV